MAGRMMTTRAPGRVNVIGDHTDYQGGLVLPMAIQLETRVSVAIGGDRVRLRSTLFPGEVDVPADGSGGPDGGATDWGRYVAGVVWALAEEGIAPVGIEGEISSTVPAGAGLSSSAALEMAVAQALLAAAGAAMEPMVVARVCQRAEVEGAGVPCGIMDQAVAALGSPHGAVLIDCRTLQTEQVRLPRSHRLVVIDSMVERTLAASGYAERRAETDEAVARLAVSCLRDATLPMLDALPDTLHRRARHVVTENSRVRETVRAMRNGNLEVVGRLLDHSHRSMAVDFGASHPEIDELVGSVRALDGVLGARMTGGGFGGTIVALVAAEHALATVDAVAPRRAWIAEPSSAAGMVA